ncbi:hypothetical protein ACI65C_009652 [Semiaphis heraclei]
MSLEENATRRWDSPTHLQLPEQPSIKFIDRFIRLRTTYWNKGYAVVLLGLIGYSITSLQFNLYIKFNWFMAQEQQTDYSYYDSMYYTVYGYRAGVMLGGVLATVFPAHNILAIFVNISSIGQLISVISINYQNAHSNIFLRSIIGMTMAVVDVSFFRVWTYWVPQDKQSIRHVPIVLSVLIFNGGYLYNTIDTYHDTQSSYTLNLLFDVIGLVWYLLWLYVINGNYSFWSPNLDFILFGGSNNTRYLSETSDVSLTRSIVSDIPWKSICTSKPFLAIVLLYMCDAQLISELHDNDLYNNEDVFKWTMKDYTIILLLFFVVLVELIPEITEPISTLNVRKFWSCSYFGSVGIFFVLKAILGNTSRANKIYHYMMREMLYLYYFGFYVNILDIAPKYASLLYGLLLSIHFIFSVLWSTVVNRILSFMIFTEVESDILKAIMCFLMAVLYANFASADLQPWAADEPEEENQQNIVENDN